VNTIDLSILQMIAVFAVFAIPIILMAVLRLEVVRETLWSALRMTIQLALIGLYLKYIFDLNLLLLNAAWMIAVILVADYSILKQAGLKRNAFFLPIFLGTTIASVSITLLFVMGIIQPKPLYDARYLIPIFGMTLGNCMRGNIISLERFYGGLRKNEREHITNTLLGATLFESIRPFLKSSLLAALNPMIATMATMGIVSLPGMMTGQILGGSLPLTAIKYQIAIVVSIFSVMMIGSFLNIIITLSVGFDQYGMLRKEIFAD